MHPMILTMMILLILLVMILFKVTTRKKQQEWTCQKEAQNIVVRLVTKPLTRLLIWTATLRTSTLRLSVICAIKDLLPENKLENIYVWKVILYRRLVRSRTARRSSLAQVL